MADLADDIRALEEALAAGPTPGPWGVMPTEMAIGLIGSEPETKQVHACGHPGQTCREAGHEPFECGDPVLWAETVNPETGESCAPRSEDMDYITAASPDRIQRVLDELKQLQAVATRYHWLCANLARINIETSQPGSSPLDTPMRVTLVQAWPDLPRTDAASADEAVIDAMKEGL